MSFFSNRHFLDSYYSSSSTSRIFDFVVLNKSDNWNVFVRPGWIIKSSVGLAHYSRTFDEKTRKFTSQDFSAD